jgi:hypothetical protein
MRSIVGTQGQRGEAWPSQVATGTAQRHEAAQANGAEASDLEGHARAGVIPTINAEFGCWQIEGTTALRTTALNTLRSSGTPQK